MKKGGSYMCHKVSKETCVKTCITHSRDLPYENSRPRNGVVQWRENESLSCHLERI